jgi:hypothetical protein
MNIADLTGRIDGGGERMTSMEERLGASFALLSSQILQSRQETNDAFLAMRTEMTGEFAAVRGEMAGGFKAARSETHDRFEKLETALAAGLGDARHYMKILYEDLLGRITLLGEAWPPRQ